MEGFARWARAELLAIGERARRRSVQTEHVVIPRSRPPESPDPGPLKATSRPAASTALSTAMRMCVSQLPLPRRRGDGPYPLSSSIWPGQPTGPPAGSDAGSRGIGRASTGAGLARRGAPGAGRRAVAEQQVGRAARPEGDPVGGDPVGQDGQDGVARADAARISRPLRLASTMPSPPGVSGNSATMPAAA